MSEDFKSGFVSIIGRPNVGKSTLLNQLVGQKIAIMSDKPQTTRNKIQGVWTTESTQAVFVDTPGIHKPQHRLGEFMVETAFSALSHMDLILYVVDTSVPWGGGEEFIVDRLRNVTTPVFIVLNKTDLVPPEAVAPFLAKLQEQHQFTQWIPISAVSGDNLDRLKQLITETLPPGPKYYPEDMVTDQPERFVMAELIREKLLHLTREEIPHSIAVVVEDVSQRSEDMVYVAGIIYVERESQKGIIIGKKGQLLKEVGKLAREEIQALLGSSVYLDLRVKVKKAWRKDVATLRNFGYERSRE